MRQLRPAATGAPVARRGQVSVQELPDPRIDGEARGGHPVFGGAAAASAGKGALMGLLALAVVAVLVALDLLELRKGR